MADTCMDNGYDDLRKQFMSYDVSNVSFEAMFKTDYSKEMVDIYNFFT